MDIKKHFTDPSLETDGVWVPYHHGARIKVARLNNDRFTRRVDELRAPHRNVLAPGQPLQLSDRQLNDILCAALSEHVLLGWEGFTADGEDLPYDRSTAYELLRAHQDFREDILRIATQRQHFFRTETEQLAKN